MGKFTMCLFLTVCFLCAAFCPIALAGDAMDQLQDMENTGVTFDGSDGRRSGMDIDFYDDGTVEIPEPTAVPVDTEDE